MGISIKNLVVRNKKYYFRSRLPKNYHENLPCEIKISIKTDILKNAVNACIVTSERLNSIISTKAIGSMTLTEIRKILADSISSSLEEHARLMADYGAICPNTQKDGMQTALNIMEYFENDRKNGNALGKEQAQNILNLHISWLKS